MCPDSRLRLEFSSLSSGQSCTLQSLLRSSTVSRLLGYRDGLYLVTAMLTVTHCVMILMKGSLLIGDRSDERRKLKLNSERQVGVPLWPLRVVLRCVASNPDDSLSRVSSVCTPFTNKSLRGLQIMSCV